MLLRHLRITVFFFYILTYVRAVSLICVGYNLAVMLRDKYFNTGNRLARTQSAVQVRTIVTVRDACARTSRRVLKKKKN